MKLRKQERIYEVNNREQDDLFGSNENYGYFFSRGFYTDFCISYNGRWLILRIDSMGLDEKELLEAEIYEEDIFRKLLTDKEFS